MIRHAIQKNKGFEATHDQHRKIMQWPLRLTGEIRRSQSSSRAEKIAAMKPSRRTKPHAVATPIPQISQVGR
jgi:hypothetical protein